MQNTNFNLIVTEDYDDLSKRCAGIMLGCVREKSDPVICLATGHSPLGAYRCFVAEAIKNKIDLSKVVFVKLDEWYGLGMDDPATCEYFISNEMLKPLGISPKNYIGFNSTAEDPEMECLRITSELEKRGPIDLMILGIGRNGHLGLNEPCEELVPSIHVAVLDKKTKGHQMLKSISRPIEAGFTLGMRDILSSKHVVFLVAGEEKVDAFTEFMRGGVTTTVPASFLRLHKNLSCVVEKSIAVAAAEK